MQPYPQTFNVNILPFCILPHAFWVNLFSLFLSIIYSITIHLKYPMNTNFISTFQTALKRLALYRHHCRLSSLRRQQHFFQPLPYPTATTKSAPAIPWPKSLNATDKTSIHWLHGTTFPTPHKSKSAKYCASAVMLPPAILLRSNAKQPPLPRSTG